MRDEEEKQTAVLLLDHIRSRNHYIKLLERWTQQLQLSGMLLLGRSILVILHGDSLNIKVCFYNTTTQNVLNSTIVL